MFNIFIFLFSLALLTLEIYSRFKMYKIKKRILLSVVDHSTILLPSSSAIFLIGISKIIIAELPSPLIYLAYMLVIINLAFIILYFNAHIVFFNDSIFAFCEEIMNSTIISYKFQKYDNSSSFLILTLNDYKNKIRYIRLRIATKDIKSVEDILISWIKEA